MVILTTIGVLGMLFGAISVWAGAAFVGGVALMAGYVLALVAERELQGREKGGRA
jgi:hypothetical protein